MRNINACKEISKLTKTGLGPNGKNVKLKILGMKKMVINHLEKVFITSDAGTIMKEVLWLFFIFKLEVAHPAAKMIVMAANMQ